MVSARGRSGNCAADPAGAGSQAARQRLELLRADAPALVEAHRLVLLAVLAVAVHAQSDVRLSLPEPFDYSLPAEARCESAAAIGDTVLAAWGTTVRVGDSIRVALRMGTLVAGHTVGTPAFVAGDESRPTSVVAVFALADRFLVLWNDRRDGRVSLFGRRVSTSGQPIGGEEEIVPSGSLMGDHAARLFGLMSRDLGALPVGWADEEWSLRGVGSGVYFLRLHGPGGAVDVGKITLLGTPGD